MSTQQTFFHFAGQPLGAGSTILPGNWGRVIRRGGWAHALALREMALESYRTAHCPALPSRLASAFVCLTREEANAFRGNGFAHHCLYRVRLATSDAPSFIADHRLVAPAGPLRPDWPELYWRGLDQQGNAKFREGETNVPDDGKGPYREMLTLSALIVEERIDKD